MFARLARHEFIESFHILKIVKHEVADFVAKIIDHVYISAAFEGGLVIVRQEGFLDVLFGVLEVQNKGAVLTRICAVQTG